MSRHGSVVCFDYHVARPAGGHGSDAMFVYKYNVCMWGIALDNSHLSYWSFGHLLFVRMQGIGKFQMNAYSKLSLKLHS